MKNHLKELRQVRHLSQVELGTILGITRQAISGFESGKYTPSLEMAIKIAQTLEVAVEDIFPFEDKNYMQTLVEKFTQWLPKGEKFTDDALNIITSAREKAASCHDPLVEPKHLLYGFLSNLNTTTALLRSSGLTFEVLIKDVDLMLESDSIQYSTGTKTDRFSSESQYILELALQLARLNRSKKITSRYLFLGLIQFVQLGNSNLDNFFCNSDLKSLQQQLLRD